MADSIGLGDVMEKVRDGRLPRGTRAILSAWCRKPHSPCELCGAVLGDGRPGLLLAGLAGEAGHCSCFCTCAWRKIGPGREEIRTLFAEDLNVSAEPVTAMAG